jgi:hypothetical protein
MNNFRKKNMENRKLKVTWTKELEEEFKNLAEATRKWHLYILRNGGTLTFDPNLTYTKEEIEGLDPEYISMMDNARRNKQ